MNTKLFPLAIIATAFFIYSVAAYGKQATQDPPKIEMDWKVGDKHAYESVSYTHLTLPTKA